MIELEILLALFLIASPPMLGYLGVRVWNATIMPQILRRPVAVFLWLQGAINSLTLFYLLMIHLFPIKQFPSLALGTILVGLQTAVLLWVIIKLTQLHRMGMLNRLPAVLLSILFLFPGGNK